MTQSASLFSFFALVYEPQDHSASNQIENALRTFVRRKEFALFRIWKTQLTFGKILEETAANSEVFLPAETIKGVRNNPRDPTRTPNQDPAPPFSGGGGGGL